MEQKCGLQTVHWMGKSLVISIWCMLGLGKTQRTCRCSSWRRGRRASIWGRKSGQARHAGLHDCELRQPGGRARGRGAVHDAQPGGGAGGPRGHERGHRAPGGRDDERLRQGTEGFWKAHQFIWPDPESHRRDLCRVHGRSVVPVPGVPRAGPGLARQRPGRRRGQALLRARGEERGRPGHPGGLRAGGLLVLGATAAWGSL
ncbi:unnamed protein product [Heterosigma akashiwo]